MRCPSPLSTATTLHGATWTWGFTDALTSVHGRLGLPRLLEAVSPPPFPSLSLTPFTSQPWAQFLSLAASC